MPMQNSQMTEELAVQQIMETAQRLRSDPAKLDAFRQQIGSRPEVIASIKKLVPKDVVRDTFSVPGEGSSGSSGVDLQASAPAPKIGSLSTPYDSVDAVKAPQQLSALIMGQAEALRKDPIQFQKYRDEVVLKNQAAMDALKKTYDPKFLETYFSGAGIPTEEDRTRQATESKRVDLRSTLNTKEEAGQLAEIVAENQGRASSILDRVKIESTLEAGPELDEVAIKEAQRKMKAATAAANSPEGLAASEQELVQLKKKQDILSTVKQASYRERQQAKAAEEFAGMEALALSDYAPDGIPDEEAFGKSFEDNKGAAARASKNFTRDLITKYHRSRLMPEIPEKEEVALKAKELKAYMNLMNGTGLSEDGRSLVPLTVGGIADREAVLRESAVRGGISPSAYYFDWVKNRKRGTKEKKDEARWFERMFSGSK